jgi:hypothetical protein
MTIERGVKKMQGVDDIILWNKTIIIRYWV